MKDFSELFASLDQTNKTNDKVELMVRYFGTVDDKDKIWTIALFTGRKPKSPINTTLLKKWAIEYANISPWMFDECYHVVGDLAEAISLLLPHATERIDKTLSEWILFIESLSLKEEAEKKIEIINAWQHLTQQERFVLNKILTGSFRIGVSHNLMVAALSVHTGIEKTVLSHRLMGNWSPTSTTYNDLLFSLNHLDDTSKPYPFFLAYPIETTPEVLGSPEAWQAEWKWDGIRSQLIKRNNIVFVWSRGEELVTDKFPEIEAIGKLLPNGTVIDGELLPYKDGKPLPFNILQTRIGRKNLTNKILSAAPIALIGYDLLEWEGNDIRTMPLYERRRILDTLINQLQVPNLVLSIAVEFKDWEDLGRQRLLSRENLAEGFMIKKKLSLYQVGRKRGDWWKWKIEPLTIDAVLVYAQKGHGRRADLYTDYTFAVWEGETLVPFAKAYSGLTDEEIRKVDYFIKRNTKEKFGPVRTVVPEMVFEIGFEGIQVSTRHKCGIAVRFPRILRWRHDKKAYEANKLEDLNQMLLIYNQC